MRISDLSVATNYAKVQSQLTQYQHTGGKTETVSGNKASEARFTLSLVSSDNGYTKEDAVLKQWNRAGSFNLYEVLNGTAKVNLQNPNPSTEELQAFEKSLQTNGVQGDIAFDMSNFAFDLRGIGFGTNNPIYQLSPDDFSKKTDYLASRYAAMQTKIQNSLSGMEQREQLEKLNSMYQEALEEMASGYSDIVGDFLERNGVSGEKGNIYQSVIDGVNSKAEQYLKFLSETPDFAKLKGTEDEWLLQDDEYVAALLRGVGTDTAAIGTKSGGYSHNDLDVLGRYVSELTTWETSSNAVNTMDEGRIGLDFAMLSMKTDVLRKQGGISSALDNTLQNLLNGFMNSFLDRLDGQLADLRNQSAALHDKEGYAALDRQAIWNVYNKTMEHYKASGNAVDALVEGAKLGANQALAKPDGSTYRHINSRLHWANFFEKDTGATTTPYTSAETPYQKYAAGWIDFEGSLRENGMGLHLNMELKPSDAYQLAELLNVKV